jgi:major histocompatibility complex class I
VGRETRDNTEKRYILRSEFGQAVVAHAFNPSTWEAEAGGFLSSRPAWSTE